MVDNREQLVVQPALAMIVFQPFSNKDDELGEIKINLAHNVPMSRVLIDSFCKFTSILCFQLIKWFAANRTLFSLLNVWFAVKSFLGVHENRGI